MTETIYRLLQSLDPVLRHPTRFSIVTLLMVSGPQTEGEIARKLEIAWGPLSTHLRKLEEEEYVETKRYPTLRGPRTYVILTEKGVRAYYRYVSTLDKIVELSRNRWKRLESTRD